MEQIELSCGTFVYGKRHMACHKDVLPLLPEACGMLGEVGAHLVVRQIEMGRIVGHSHVVQTTADDVTYMARRPKRHWDSRFVVGREAVPCSTVTIIAHRARENGKPVIKIVTAYVGVPAPREPGDTTLTAEQLAESVEFWNNHAFVEGVN